MLLSIQHCKSSSLNRRNAFQRERTTNANSALTARLILSQNFEGVTNLEPLADLLFAAGECAPILLTYLGAVIDKSNTAYSFSSSTVLHNLLATSTHLSGNGPFFKPDSTSLQ